MKKLIKIFLAFALFIPMLSGCNEIKNEISDDIKNDAESSNTLYNKRISADKIENIILSKMSDNIKIYYHKEQDILVKIADNSDYDFQIKDNILEISANKKEEKVGNIIIFLPGRDYNELKINNKATTKIFDIKAHTLEVYSENEVVVDKTELGYLRLSTKNNKVVITKSNIDDIFTETTGNNKIIVDNVITNQAIFKTDTGDIFAKLQGKSSDYQILKNIEEINKDKKFIATITNGGEIDVKFL